MTLEYTDVPDPDCSADDLIIRVKACGICGSDIHGATGKTGRRIPPLIMGHEAAGVVQRVGPNVTDFQEGDRVCFDSTVYCNRCEACKQGLFNRCERRRILGVSTPEFSMHGALAEYVAVPHWIAARIPDELSFGRAALLEPVSIAMHAVNRSSIGAGDTVLIIGAGTIGLCAMQCAKLRGPGRLVACDISEFRLKKAREMGADETVRPEEMAAQDAHVTFEVVGLAETLLNAISATRTGGRVVMVGNLEPAAELNPQEIVARELNLIGSYASAGEFREAIGLVASGRIEVDPLISDVLPLSEGAAAFERLLKGDEDLLKIVLEP
jgi:L-iditol 2-dehydrogenase